MTMTWILANWYNHHGPDTDGKSTKPSVLALSQIHYKESHLKCFEGAVSFLRWKSTGALINRHFFASVPPNQEPDLISKNINFTCYDYFFVKDNWAFQFKKKYMNRYCEYFFKCFQITCWNSEIIRKNLGLFHFYGVI